MTIFFVPKLSAIGLRKGMRMQSGVWTKDLHPTDIRQTHSERHVSFRALPTAAVGRIYTPGKTFCAFPPLKVTLTASRLPGIIRICRCDGQKLPPPEIALKRGRQHQMSSPFVLSLRMRTTPACLQQQFGYGRQIGLTD
jgi:hypothetical protein